ncbi:hypothetical protein MPER_13208 [Moniliophthora perniciosa FA553]|nr:hypothetical protein MPER_13208 [Moniliophthora perniciosa FA553]
MADSVEPLGRGLQYCNSSNEPHGILIPQPLRENVAISRFCWQPRIRILSNLQIEASSIVILRKEPGRYCDSAWTPRKDLQYSGSVGRLILEEGAVGIVILQQKVGQYRDSASIPGKHLRH